jgi:leucyl aminopeptidase
MVRARTHQSPANDCAPASLADALSDLGQTFGAKVNVIAGGKLLAENFPLLHAVGRASDREPCLADLTWGDTSHPKVTLVGKGICFDTGGLDIAVAVHGAMKKMAMRHPG